MTFRAVKDERAVIILDELNFLFYNWQIEEAIFLWESNVPWREIVERIRPVDTKITHYQPYSVREAETFMLLMHLGLEGRLRERPGKIWGA